MNVKYLLLASALVAAHLGTSSAQTVPAEAWVGAPIPVVGSQASRAEVLAGLTRASSEPQAIPENWVGSKTTAGVVAGEATRAEVTADLNLYTRSGLNDPYVAERMNFEPANGEVSRRVAMYQRLRTGPEFRAEVARVEAGGFQAPANVIAQVNAD